MEGAEREIWIARAVMCELLALSFRYPEESLVQAVASGEWVDAAVEAAEALDIELPDDFGAGGIAQLERGCSGSLAEELMHELRPEATRLFVGSPEPVCFPFEGVWRSRGEEKRALLFVNPLSLEVERFCHACGLGSPEGVNEPLDNVATELELLQILALRAAGVEGSGVPDGDLPRGSAAAAYDLFFREHVGRWMPEFAESVASESRQPFFRDAAQLLCAFTASR